MGMGRQNKKEEKEAEKELLQGAAGSADDMGETGCIFKEVYALTKFFVNFL